MVNFLLEMEIEGSIEFTEEFEEPNFQKHLEATEISIHTVLAEGLFVKEGEVTIPDGRFYHRDDYDSVDEWVESRISDCKDLDAFHALSTRMRSVASGREHRLHEYWKEYRVLLRKPQT
jgi:hypothetical protein